VNQGKWPIKLIIGHSGASLDRALSAIQIGWFSLITGKIQGKIVKIRVF